MGKVPKTIDEAIEQLYPFLANLKIPKKTFTSVEQFLSYMMKDFHIQITKNWHLSETDPYLKNSLVDYFYDLEIYDADQMCRYLFETVFNRIAHRLCIHCKNKKFLICPQCNGDKAFRCFNCDGRGLEKRGAYIDICRYCYGEHKVTCKHCSGKGEISCIYCRSET